MHKSIVLVGYFIVAATAFDVQAIIEAKCNGSGPEVMEEASYQFYINDLTPSEVIAFVQCRAMAYDINGKECLPLVNRFWKLGQTLLAEGYKAGDKYVSHLVWSKGQELCKIYREGC